MRDSPTYPVSETVIFIMPDLPLYFMSKVLLSSH